MRMDPDDWQRPEVLAMCKGCAHYGECAAALVSMMIIEEGGKCRLRTEAAQSESEGANQ